MRTRGHKTHPVSGSLPFTGTLCLHPALFLAVGLGPKGSDSRSMCRKSHLLQASVLLSQGPSLVPDLQHSWPLCLLSERRKQYSISDHPVTNIRHHRKLVESIETRGDLTRIQNKNSVT